MSEAQPSVSQGWLIPGLDVYRTQSSPVAGSDALRSDARSIRKDGQDGTSIQVGDAGRHRPACGHAWLVCSTRPGSGLASRRWCSLTGLVFPMVFHFSLRHLSHRDRADNSVADPRCVGGSRQMTLRADPDEYCPSGQQPELALAQRADFLRPDSVLVILALTDENDCSIRVGGQSWLVSSRTETMTRASSACAENPNDACCYPCPGVVPDGCERDAPLRCGSAHDARGGLAEPASL